MRLFLIRHGRQSDARCNVDVGLSDEGRRQAELVARRIEPWGVRHLVSSDLIRARETAEIINARLRLPLTVMPELRELDFGEMQGLTDAEIDARFADFKAAQRAMRDDLRYPGGETIADVLARALPAIQQWADVASGSVAIATHGVVIRSLVAHVSRTPLPRWRLVASGLENGSITELLWHPASGEFSLERLNDYAHLEAHPELLRAAWGVSEN